LVGWIRAEKQQVQSFLAAMTQAWEEGFATLFPERQLSRRNAVFMRSIANLKNRSKYILEG